MQGLSGEILIFLISSGVIAFAGTLLSSRADMLADRTGLGEAFMGAVFLGAVTSLPGITASVTAAFENRPALALSNAAGGIAAQTAFLALADFVYRKVNLEHAGASAANLLNGALLICLLALLLGGMLGPDVTVLGVHPVTPALFLAYFFGLRLVYRGGQRPMWRPRQTPATREDRPDPPQEGEPSTMRLTLELLASSAAVVVAGWFLTKSVASLATATALPESAAGAVLLAVPTSLPEMVTSIAAVRRGALTLAVSGILGGNAFDTLFAAVADLAYRPGSVYHAASQNEALILAVSILMTGVLLLGLLHREERGIANIGFESFFLLVLYALLLVILAFA